MWPDLLLLANLAVSLYMTGLIWFVQVVHYPLFGAVPPPDFSAYEARHQSLTTWVTAPPMLAELGLSAAYLLARPASTLVWLAAALTLLLWASTFFLQVPLHGRLSQGFELEAWRSLVASNWLRTSAWTLRSALLLWLLWERMRPAHG
jgi:hypothetical protein